MMTLAGWGFFAPTGLAEQHQKFELSAYRGKVVYLDFWASWWLPCRNSFPWMNAMQRKYGTRGLVVIGVNLEVEKRLAARVLKLIPAHFKVVYDPEGRLAREYKPQGMPNSFLFDREGHLSASQIGFRRSETEYYEEEIASLLD